jgi:hypothetical protein
VVPEGCVASKSMLDNDCPLWVPWIGEIVIEVVGFLSVRVCNIRHGEFFLV